MTNYRYRLSPMYMYCMVGHYDILSPSEELLVCRVCTVLAGGLVQRWMPRPREPTTTIQGEGGREGGGEGGKKLGKQGTEQK